MSLCQYSHSQLLDMFTGYTEHMAVLDNKPFFPMADIDSLHYGYTPLSLAILLGREEWIEHLINAGASVNAVDISAVRPLFVAAQFGNECVLQLLLDANVDLMALDRDRNTACHLAALNSNPNILARLIEAGVPCDQHNSSKMRPIHIAAGQNENAAVISLLIGAGCRVEQCEGDSKSPAHCAASNRNTAVLESLIVARTPLNCSTLEDGTPLHVAVASNNNAAVSLLIDANIDVNARSANGITPLVRALTNANPLPIVEQLVSAGARFDIDDVNVSDSQGCTPLMSAARHGSAQSVKMLLDAGARAHDTDQNGFSACLIAASNTDPSVLCSLIEAGGHVRARANSGDTLLSIALKHDNVNVLAALEEGGMNVVAEFDKDRMRHFSTAVSSPAARGLVWLIRRGANVKDICDSSNYFPEATLAAMTVLFGVGVDVYRMSNWTLSEMEVYGHNYSRYLSLTAAGVDWDEYENDLMALGAFAPDLGEFMAAAGDTDCSNYSPRQIACLRHNIVRRQFEFFRARAFEICTAMQTLDKSAWEMCEILAHVFAPRELVVPIHKVWRVVTTIKHFK